jgi:hypothetical protein
MAAEPRDPVALIEADHRKVEQLFDRIEAAEGDERRDLVEELTLELLVHMQLEEQEIYPLVEQDVDAEMAEEAETEHGLAREGLDRVRELSPDGPGFGAALDMVKAGILHHVREEEDEVLPKLQEQLSADELAQLGQTLADAKAALLEAGPEGLRAGSAKRGGGSRRRGGQAKGGDEPTKADLVAQAKDKGLTGYSKMNKDELAKALQDA